MTNFRNYRALTNMALTGSNMAIGLSHLSFEIQSHILLKNDNGVISKIRLVP